MSNNSSAADFVGAGADFSNPMGGVFKAQAAYHMHQYNKEYVAGMKQAVANEAQGDQTRREMGSAQMQASNPVFGQNGITEENGYVQNADGTISYVGSQ